ncbi:MAG: phosphate ABC transporter substrate-binding protein PstS [Microbacterium sp.]|uniref:Phosphate ABC transporter substrate-binding protein PstS n=1 Tax=Microbacterium ginsengisoli TaxID=400772 RepID=A0A0F0LTB6_9MICO|nr:phosphate ABC transporter substrate-binding protein PstS [Microbacterium ginsengisoli]KJL36378.1 Phosphate-binding protein PstS precursor [Microbacterium ginsengisoli]MAL07197.1 phosphate ABC transporter substrate-binding protein PstS [Microbacterium sp.]MBN9209081.1 phosphate ABC transporter substrate-binding protein PstS [Microbacterium ginsengisoli]HAN25712.1 phosphate ABC transporter substrate-binding protein PstS [Microbacterium ginsengisoli]
MNARTRIAAALAAVILLTTIATPAQADSYAPISGSGSTWSQNALDQWRKNVASNYGMTVNYSGTGSSAGRTDFINQTVDFAISEIPFQSKPEDGSAPEVPPVSYAYMPIVAGGTSLMYNLKIGGKRVTNLRLSGEVIAKIFTGQITKWNDPAVQADNPGLAMPDRTITPVYRSDGSGTSAQFTLWMSSQFPSIWTYGMRSQFPAVNPTFKGQNGSLGVAGYVSQDYGEGAITYVEYSYAMKSGFPVAKVLNKAGYFVEPTYQSVAVALLAATINPDLTQNLTGVYNNADARTYPMSSYSYMIVPTQTTKVFTTDKGKTLSTFANYMICEGQQQAAALGYSPLPMNLVQAASAVIAKIPGTVGAVDLNKCNNPTFKAGDSPSSNQLASTAPQPAACDKQGPTQCTSGTGGAQQATAGTGSGAVNNSGGTATSGTAGGTTGATGGTTSGGTSSTPVYDANGNLVSGAAAGGSGQSAVSSPFTLASDGWGAEQYLMLAAGVLLLAAVILPPTLIRRRRHHPGTRR